MMGSYGGSAFLTVYLAFTFLFAIPALMAEIALGKASGNGTVDAFRLTMGKTAGNIAGYFLMIVITISGSYYAVVVGNVFFTTAYSIIEGFQATNTDRFNEMLGNGSTQYICTALLVIFSMFIVFKGLNKGIEWVSNRIMPFFVVALLYIIIHVLLLPGAVDKLGQFLRPDFNLIGSRELFAALGQSFFSVGLGGTFVVVYAGYINKNESIPRIAMYTGLGDLGSSLLISIFLVPSILIFNLPMDSGPNLIFRTIPRLFESMSGGRLIGSLFLLSVFLVAFLSLIAAYEVVIRSLTFNSSGLRRKRIILFITILQLLLIIPSCFFPHIIGTLDLVFGSGMQVFGSLLAILAVTWYFNRLPFLQQLFKEPSNKFFFTITYIWIKWIIPLVLAAVLIGYIYSLI